MMTKFILILFIATMLMHCSPTKERDTTGLDNDFVFSSVSPRSEMRYSGSWRGSQGYNQNGHFTPPEDQIPTNKDSIVLPKKTLLEACQIEQDSAVCDVILIE